ncbi:MAG: sugar transferase [Balneolales bacterium]|nr:sugar transferase [Balneolales bacterium]
MNIHLMHLDVNFASAGVILSFYWVLIFVIAGLYKKLYLVSRLDEFFRVLKTTIIGGLILYFMLDFGDRASFEADRAMVIYYWGFIFGIVALNRFIIRTIQRFYAQKGKGLHRTIIVGTGHNAKVAFDDLIRNKTLGMEVLGYVQVNGKSLNPEIGIQQEEVIGHLENIAAIVEEYKVQDVLVAIEPERRTDLVDVISKVDQPDIVLKLLPDFYQLVSGLNKTNQIFGMPIIEISPEPMPLWERGVKRIMDVVVSLSGLILFSPVYLILAIWIKIDSPGAVIYKQTRVGRKGRPFTMYKFRTMRSDAESATGPTWASENDPRVTKLGYWLRKLRLDEIPQLVNVLQGTMSLVGPRPERPHFVDQFKYQIPLYTRRLRVRPGITGWAQVKWKYDSSLDDVKEKTKYDLYYVENTSLKMDLKILIITILTMIKGKGQ